MEYKLRVLSMHEIGQRANQEDYMYPAPGMASDNDRCFVLCDGMGGHDSGEVASQAVCNTMGGYVSGNCPSDMVFTADDLRAALAAAYDELDARDTHAAKKMGTTMTFANFHKGGCLVAHMGDSRVYHMRPSVGILFETRDHSLVNDLIKVGELTEETAKTFKQKNVITRCMQPNNERRSRADIKEITDIRPGDYFFMCSDGVNEVMESRHLANVILDDSFTDDEKIAIIRDNTTEARDNHTAYLIHVLDVKGAPLVRREAPVAEPMPASEKPKSKVKSKIVLSGIALLALLSAVVYFTVLSPSEQATADVSHSSATVGEPAENKEVGGKELSEQLNPDEVAQGSQDGSNDNVDDTGTADKGEEGNSSAANAKESGNDGLDNAVDANANESGNGGSDNIADAEGVGTVVSEDTVNGVINDEATSGTVTAEEEQDAGE